MKRILDKIREVEEFCGELATMVPESLEEYEKDLKTKAACERYAEKITEAFTDLAFLLIKHRGLETPEDDKDAFSVLAKAGVIDGKLAERLQDAKGMRNVIAHEYGQVDDGIVFNAVSEELGKDAREFAERARKSLK